MRIKKVPDRWLLLAELTIMPGERIVWTPPMPGSFIHFANGEVLWKVTVHKPYTSRQTVGVARLYRTVRGYPKFITTPNVYVQPEWLDRTTINRGKL